MKSLLSDIPALASQAGEVVGRTSMGTVIGIKLLAVANLANANGLLTAVLTSVSIIYMGLKAFNEWKTGKKNSRTKKNS